MDHYLILLKSGVRGTCRMGEGFNERRPSVLTMLAKNEDGGGKQNSSSQPIAQHPDFKGAMMS